MTLTKTHQKALANCQKVREQDRAKMEPHVFAAHWTNGRDQMDFDLEAHVLTDKAEFKILPCRECKRPCIVTRFAAPAKVACNDHRDRRSDATRVVGEFDRSKETHVLTDKPKTKEVPCRHCKRPCVVTTFATPEKVACNDCRTGASVRKRTTVTKDENGRHREQTKVEFADPVEMEWDKFVISMPFIDRDYTEAEWQEAEEERTLQLQAHELLDCARADRRKAETALEIAPNPDKLSDAKAKAKAQKRIEELESQIRDAQSRESEMEAAQKRHRARRDELSRIAWLRAAFAENWTLTDRTLTGTVDGVKREVVLPSNYLDAEAIKQVTA